MTRLAVTGAELGYEGRDPVSTNLNLEIPDGQFSVIIGPNACGKSTLLKALARLLAPNAGAVLLDSKPMSEQPTKHVARQLGLLPQGPVAPDGVRVRDLVARGRYPYQSLWSAWSEEDETAVTDALAATGMSDHAFHYVDELSGGQRQRVWMSVALAQQTEILLLDEPTTYLDLNHQIELLELCRELNRDRGMTLVAVLHELNQAARYADHIIAMSEGAVVAEGSPRSVISEELLAEYFAVDARIMEDPESGTPLIIPRWAHSAR